MLLAEERRGEFDALRAERALAELRRRLERDGGTLAVHSYHCADANAGAVAEAVETPSLFGARTLIVLRGAESLDERAQQRLADALDRQAPQVTLAVVARAADMRKRFFARCRDLAERIPVDHPRHGEMRQWADAFAKERGRRLDDDARDLLVDCTGRDLLVLGSELDKLAAAVAPGRPITLEDVGRVTASGREHGNFEITDALCVRDGAAAMRALGLALDEGAAPIAIIGAIAASFRTVLAGADLIARGRSLDDVQRELAVHPYQRRTLQAALRAHRAPALRRAMVRLAEIDLGAKSGTGDPRAMLETWVLDLCAPRRRGAGRGRGGLAAQAGAVS